MDTAYNENRTTITAWINRHGLTGILLHDGSSALITAKRWLYTKPAAGDIACGKRTLDSIKIGETVPHYLIGGQSGAYFPTGKTYDFEIPPEYAVTMKNPITKTDQMFSSFTEFERYLKNDCPWQSFNIQRIGSQEFQKILDEKQPINRRSPSERLSQNDWFGF